jgi:hypothetical protein
MLTICKPVVPTRAGVALGIALVTSLVLSGTQMQARVRLAPATEASVSPRPPDRQAARLDSKLTFPLGTVIQGADTVNLIAMLPWWRAPLGPGAHPGQDESQVLTACDSWLGFPFANGESDSLTVRLALIQKASAIESAISRIPVADPNELNEIDLAAAPAPQPRRSWWPGALLVVFGLAVAAGTAEARLIIRRARWARLGLVLGRARYVSLYLPGRPLARFVAVGWHSVAPLKRWVYSLLEEFLKPLPGTSLGPQMNDWVAYLGIVRARTVRCCLSAPMRLSNSWRGLKFADWHFLAVVAARPYIGNWASPGSARSARQVAF